MGKDDVLDALAADHREVERLFAAYAASVEGAQRRELADRVILELVRHAQAEEQHLYPAIRRVLPDGDKIADAELEEHAAAELTMDAVDGADPAGETFTNGMARLMTQVNEHVAEEEHVVFPQLRQALNPAERQRLGEKVAQAKKLAPTHPHPLAPDKPPFNKLLAPGVAVADRVRDWLASGTRRRI